MMTMMLATIISLRRISSQPTSTQWCMAAGSTHRTSLIFFPAGLPRNRNSGERQAEGQRWHSHMYCVLYGGRFSENHMFSCSVMSMSAAFFASWRELHCLAADVIWLLFTFIMQPVTLPTIYVILSRKLLVQCFLFQIVCSRLVFEKFRIYLSSFFCHINAYSWLASCKWYRELECREKPLYDPKSLATFSHTLSRIQT